MSPLPPPTGSVFLSAEWRALALLSWEVDPQLLREFVPRGTVLDLYEGKTYVSLVGFLFLDTWVLGLPIPFHRDFEEINLRFYVRREVAGEVRRAVCFIREVVSKWAVATVARWAYNEPYQTFPMRHSVRGFGLRTGAAHDANLAVEYGWRVGSTWNEMRLACAGTASALDAASLEWFIAEHYWGYCRQRDGGTVEYRVEHPPWNIWRATEAAVSAGVADYYPSPFREVLRQPPTNAFLADGSPVRVYKPQRI